MSSVLAFDFGASGGRAVKATYRSGTLEYEEIHRFENKPVEENGTLCWDFGALLAEVRTGIQKAGRVDSIGFDTWGVDFGLLGKDGALLARPVHYRDKRTAGLPAKTESVMPGKTLYAATGNQIMNINTLFQLVALKEQDPALFARADRLLFMPDLFAYSLCGNAVCERSIASTSQMFNPATREWSAEVLSAFGIPETLFAPLAESGTVAGTYDGMKIISVAGHDTQCAVAAIPAVKAEKVAFLSCGTWSLIGTELDAPVLTETSMERELSNECGANGKINYLKNIIGLWLIQESRREWKRQGTTYSFADLEALAREAPGARCCIDPDDPSFAPPGDVPERIREFCRKTGQYVPRSPGEIMRCVYESLAFKYRSALEQLSETTGKRFERLHVLGGGCRDRFLCQTTADFCGIPVVAGPVEATALGNILIQLTALGDIPDIAAGRALLRKTEKLKRYEPAKPESDGKVFEKFRKIIDCGR